MPPTKSKGHQISVAANLQAWVLNSGKRWRPTLQDLGLPSSPTSLRPGHHPQHPRELTSILIPARPVPASPQPPTGLSQAASWSALRLCSDATCSRGLPSPWKWPTSPHPHHSGVLHPVSSQDVPAADITSVIIQLNCDWSSAREHKVHEKRYSPTHPQSPECGQRRTPAD